MVTPAEPPDSGRDERAAVRPDHLATVAIPGWRVPGAVAAGSRARCPLHAHAA